MQYNAETDVERFYSPDDEYSRDVRFSNAQLTQIRYGVENCVDVSVYAHPDIPYQIMEKIRIDLQKSGEVDGELTPEQMNLIEQGRMAGVDTSPMENVSIRLPIMRALLGYLCSVHSYFVRFTTDGGTSVSAVQLHAYTKSEVLAEFNKARMKPGMKIVDIREPELSA